MYLGEYFLLRYNDFVITDNSLYKYWFYNDVGFFSCRYVHDFGYIDL